MKINDLRAGNRGGGVPHWKETGKAIEAPSLMRLKSSAETRALYGNLQEERPRVFIVPVFVFLCLHVPQSEFPHPVSPPRYVFSRRRLSPVPIK
jgi:hypothetical protein